MKKVTIIGDIHGLDVWKQIITDNPDSDLFIFMGDYFDSFHISITEQVNNFFDILQFKQSNPDKVVILIGNHDFHYTDYNSGTYSGFNTILYYQVNSKLKELIKDGTLVMAHKIGNYLFTHAGVTKTWCENNNIDTTNIVESLNDYMLYKSSVFDFNIGKNFSAYGDDITQGPLWVRPKSLFQNCLEYIHVVGHTQTNNIEFKSFENYGYILVDTLPNYQYLNLLFDDNETNVKTEIKKY